MSQFLVVVTTWANIGNNSPESCSTTSQVIEMPDGTNAGMLQQHLARQRAHYQDIQVIQVFDLQIR